MPDRANERARPNEALEHANTRIAKLEGELEQEKQQLARLRAELVALDEAVLVSASPVDETASIRAPAEKLMIFRSLFRGRRFDADRLVQLAAFDSARQAAPALDIPHTTPQRWLENLWLTLPLLTKHADT